MSRYASIPSRKIFILFAFFAGFVLPAAAATDARLSESYGRLPLQFEANRGQTDKHVRFLSRGPGYSLYLTAGETVLVLAKPNPDARHDARAPIKSVALRMSLVGAARKPVVSGLDEQSGKANYFIGKDPAKWHTNVPTYAKVYYQNVYHGIDLLYYGNQSQLEYDFVVAPGADPKRIVLDFKGADKLEIDAEGDLVLHAPGGDIRQHKPIVYQENDGIRQEIAGSYVRKGANRVGFQVAAYDTSKPLVIDPVVLAYSTYLGTNGNDSAASIAVDAAGNAYVTGAASLGFPTTPGAFQTTGGPVFVTKLNPTGSALVYSTYLGGTEVFRGPAITIDADGNAYVTGSATSNFPTTAGAFQPNYSGGTDAFVAKLNPEGSALIYSTYLGGTNLDGGTSIALDAARNVYVTGGTSSTDFPTTNAFQSSKANGTGNPDAFVTKLDPTGSTLVYSTYLGGDLSDTGFGIAVTADGSAYVTGDTGSANFPTTAGAFQPVFGGKADAFVAKLDPTGAALVYSTYLGGSDSESGSAIAVDADGNAYVTGGTQSTGFPTTPNAFQPAFSGGFDPFCICVAADAFVTKLDPAGSSLVYSTYLGGHGTDGGLGIAVDGAHNAYVTGGTSSTDFPTANAFQANRAGGEFDAFVTKLNPAGSALVYSTYLGGRLRDIGRGIALDAANNAYVTGDTGFDKPATNDFPTTPGAFQTTFGGIFDAFVAKISGIALLVIDKDGIDDKRPPNFFSETQVNDDVAALGVRAQLRFFRDQIGQTITLPAGAVGDEGWFALKTIPQSWAQAGGAAGFVGNPAANPEDPAPQGTGPGLGAPDANGDPDSLLKNVPDVTPLRATALNNLIGREVCAVVYDNQVGINQDMRTGDLRGANLGTVAFQVVALTPSTDPSSSSLPNVQVRIRDARTMCRGPFALLTDAEAPAGAQ